MFKAGSNYLPRLNAIVAKQVADEQQLKGFLIKSRSERNRKFLYYG